MKDSFLAPFFLLFIFSLFGFCDQRDKDTPPNNDPPTSLLRIGFPRSSPPYTPAAVSHHCPPNLPNPLSTVILPVARYKKTPPTPKTKNPKTKNNPPHQKQKKNIPPIFLSLSSPGFFASRPLFRGKAKGPFRLFSEGFFLSIPGGFVHPELGGLGSLPPQLATFPLFVEGLFHWISPESSYRNMKRITPAGSLLYAFFHFPLTVASGPPFFTASL